MSIFQVMIERYCHSLPIELVHEILLYSWGSHAQTEQKSQLKLVLGELLVASDIRAAGQSLQEYKYIESVDLLLMPLRHPPGNPENIKFPRIFRVNSKKEKKLYSFLVDWDENATPISLMFRRINIPTVQAPIIPTVTVFQWLELV